MNCYYFCDIQLINYIIIILYVDKNSKMLISKAQRIIKKIIDIRILCKFIIPIKAKKNDNMVVINDRSCYKRIIRYLFKS